MFFFSMIVEGDQMTKNWVKPFVIILFLVTLSLLGRVKVEWDGRRGVDWFCLGRRDRYLVM